ncbi:MAG: hypothetical protein AABW54_00810 [Candidatus Micrarchaeota archaeon]
MPEEAPLEEKISDLDSKVQLAASERRKISQDNAQAINELRDCIGQAKASREARDAASTEGKRFVEEKKAVLAELARVKAALEELDKSARVLEALVTGDYGTLKRKADALEWALQTECRSPREEKLVSKQLQAVEKMLKPAAGLEGKKAEMRKLSAEKRGLIERLRRLDAAIDADFAKANELHKLAEQKSSKANSLSRKIGSNLEALGEKRDTESELKEKLSGALEEKAEVKATERRVQAEKHALEAKSTHTSMKERAKAIREKLAAGGKITALDMQVLAQADE